MSGPLAFPQNEISIGEHPDFQGLTKRELIAAMAMQAVIPQIFDIPRQEGVPDDAFPSAVAIVAVMCADALIAELAKVKP